MNIKNYISIVLIVMCQFLTITFTYAQGRDLPGVSIVSRSQRGADESLRIRNGKEIDGSPISNDIESETGTKNTDTNTIPSPVNPLQIAENYLKENFPDDQKIDSTIENEGNKALIRPLQYRNTKKAIIIHHTVSDTEKVHKEGIQQHIQNIYKFHTQTRGRGDIGYNFLIDDQGIIYEGRAGGESVVAAHTKRNNPNTIGIALIGNFEHNEPTKEQINATIKLATALANKYNINPDKPVTYHKRSNTYPYLLDITLPSIIGHEDAGSTSCPGEKLYSQLDTIREEVKKSLLSQKIKGKLKDIINDDNIHTTETDELRVSLPYQGSKIINCEILDDESITIKECKLEKDKINISLTQNWKPTFGTKAIIITDENEEKTVFYEKLLWKKDITNLLASRLKNKQNNMEDKEPIEKVKYKISREELQETSTIPVKVLLYELSTTKTQWTVICTSSCRLKTIDRERTGNNITVHIYDDNTIFVGDNNTGALTEMVSVESTNTGGIIQITNYDRKSYAGIPRNVFRGKMLIQKEDINNLETQTVQKQFVVINELDLKSYLEGIAESSDQEPDEKRKTLALLTKQYILYYLNGKNEHPSIPPSATYNSIDDPRSFQKYVGQGFEDTSTKRSSALEKTKNTFILYHNTLPILPYFSCSPGYTKSAQKQRGRNDAPYLQSVIDFKSASCEPGQGHGVGLSGKGATYMAQNGIDFKSIIKYYYQDVDVIDMFF